MYNAANRVIEIFGGHQQVADALGLNISRIYRWTYPKERGGTDGLVPAVHQQALLSKAIERGIELLPHHFFDEPNTKKSKTTNGKSN